MTQRSGFSEEDRRLLQDSLRRLLERQWSAQSAAGPGTVREFWSALAGQGLAALGGGDEYGGLGEVLMVIEELGRWSCPAPMIGAALANIAFAPAADDASELLEQVHAGSRSLAIAFARFRRRSFVRY